MKKISLDLFIDYKFIADLTAYKGGLLFNEYNQDPDTNSYKVKGHYFDLDTNEDKVLTDLKGSNDFCIIDDEIYTMTYEDHRTKFQSDKNSFSLPLNVLKIDAYQDHYIVLAKTNKESYDLYKWSDEEIAAYDLKVKENKDNIVFDEYPFLFNGEGIVNGDRKSLFLIDRGDLSIRPLTDRMMDVESYDIGCDEIVYSGVDFDAFKGKWSKIYRIDLSSFETSILYTDRMQIQRVFYDVDVIVVVGTFAKDYGAIESSKFYILKDGMMELAVDSEYSLYNSITTDCRYGKLKNFLKDGQKAYFVTTDGTDSILISYHDRTIEKELVFNGSIDDLAFLDGKLYVVAMKDQALQEVYDGKMDKLTDLNGDVLKDRYVAKPQKIIVEKPMPVDGFALLPADFSTDRSYPAILDIHGGPRCAYGSVFVHEMQYWVNEGYVVMFCNPRGSDGKGNAFGDLRHNYGKIDYEDIMDFVDTVLAKYPNIDRDNMAVTGGSYGGYMTNWIIGHNDRFKCAVSQRSITNWISMVCASDYGIDFPIEQEFADLYNCQAELWDMSPLKYANNVKTPTLFIHSSEDYRCPIVEGIQMYMALKCRGVDSKLVGFIGENHELSRSGKPRQRIKRLKEISEWIFKYTKEEQNGI